MDAAHRTDDDYAVAFCPHCGTRAGEPLPDAGQRHKCSGCGRTWRMPMRGHLPRINCLISALQNRNESVWKTAQEGLLRLGSDYDRALLQALRERPYLIYRVLPKAEQLGRERVANAMIERLRERNRAPLLEAGRILIAGVAVSLGVLGLYIAGEGELAAAVGLFASLGIVGAVVVMAGRASRRYNRNTISALLALGDPRATGALAIAHKHPRLRRYTGSALRQLLPLLRRRDAGDIHTGERQAIERLLDSTDHPLVLATLKGLERIGNEDTVRQMRRLAGMEGLDAKLREAAEGSVRRLEERLAWEAENPSLLRAADSADTEQELLLRRAKPDMGSDELLRPADED